MRTCLISVLILLLFSCTKVDSLSDSAQIKSFTIDSYSPSQIALAKDSILIRNDSVVIPLLSGRTLFPLTLSAKVKLSPTTDDVLGIDFKNIIIERPNEAKSFHLIAASGLPTLWKIVVKELPNADITAFEVKSISNGIVNNVTIRNNEVRITLQEIPNGKIEIEPVITITPEAKFKDYTPGDKLIFNSYSEIKTITVIAVNGDEKIWKIRFTPPIENSDFELWGEFPEINGGIITINPIPGKGYGWATANNSYVKGTLPISYNGGRAAQMSTSVQDLKFIGLGDLIAAGTLYSGYFALNLQLDNPRSMTFFGIPFITRPTSVSVDAQYIPGPELKQSEKRGDSYVLKTLPGTDKGHIWIELLHWSGSGALAYHGHTTTGVTVIGRGEYIFEGTSVDKNWRRLDIPIIYNSSLTPTHIAIVMTSSKDGDKFKGAPGSILNADNFVINY